MPQIYVWYIYFASVAFLAYWLFRPVQPRAAGTESFVLALVLAVPISVLSGFLGVGPGFLALPTLILVGFNPKKAAAMNAFAVTPPSFSSLLPHLATAQWDFPTAIQLALSKELGCGRQQTVT